MVLTVWLVARRVSHFGSLKKSKSNNYQIEVILIFWYLSQILIAGRMKGREQRGKKDTKKNKDTKKEGSEFISKYHLSVVYIS